jgi:Holliday junction resolvase RusA-like endonuclease
MMKFTLLGHPATKKNSSVIAGKRLLPSRLYREYAKLCKRQFKTMNLDTCTELYGDCTLECKAIFFCRDGRRRDLVNLMQALADILEENKIVANDALIISWDGTRMAVDKDNPRVEVELTPFII